VSTKRFDSTFDFHDLDVVIRCRSCNRREKITGYQFRFMFNGGMPCPLPEAKRRLRCKDCGHKGADIAPVPDLG
jgi:hypothetical protein